MLYFLRNIIESILLPPGIFVLLTLIISLSIYKGKINYRYRRKNKNYSYIFLTILFLLIYTFSTYFGQLILVNPLERGYKPLNYQLLNGNHNSKTAIVILGGGIKQNTLRGPQIGERTLGRLYEGAKIYQDTKYDIVVTGGKIPGQRGLSEAEMMKEVLINFGVTKEKIISETEALTTWQNAVNTTKILNELNYEKIILVTNAIHMNRAIYSFKNNWEKELTPAPALYLGDQQVTVLDFLPNTQHLNSALRAFHEWVGFIWYLFL